MVVGLFGFRPHRFGEFESTTDEQNGGLYWSGGVWRGIDLEQKDAVQHSCSLDHSITEKERLHDIWLSSTHMVRWGERKDVEGDEKSRDSNSTLLLTPHHPPIQSLPSRLELGTRSYPRYQSFLLHGAQGPTLIAQLVTHIEQNSRH